MNPLKALFAGVAGIGALIMVAGLLCVLALAGGLVFGFGFIVLGTLAGGSTGWGLIGGTFAVLLVMAMIGGSLS